MTDEPEIVRTSLRLPKKLYDRLAEASEGKTMHAEILHRLEASFRSPAHSETIHFPAGSDVAAILRAAADEVEKSVKAARGPDTPSSD